jgi:predicted metal-dependent HD superfamily phosphohydrolase
VAGGGGGRCGDREVDWVAGTIEATADHLASARATLAEGALGATSLLLVRARLWVLDLDLSPLGEAPAAFARNAGLLRLERPDLDDSAWRQQVLAFLARLHAAPRLYRTPVVQAAFEARARANIARAISKLRAA